MIKRGYQNIMKLSVYLITLLLLLVISACGGSSDSPTPSPSSDPELKNLSVIFADYDAETGKAGDFDFLDTGAIDAKPFYVFGSALPSGNLNPTFEYLVDEDAAILSPIAGTVSEIGYRSDDVDYTVIIIPSDATDWMVVLDHVLNVSVEVDDVVTVGQPLGTAGTWFGGLGRTELQVINDINGLSYCPFAVFDSNLEITFQQKVTDLMSQWETYVNDPDIYDQDSMVYPGCLVESTSG
ncbi:MAG: hypothetical protein KAV87_68930 [Desulfobacteraceae bacterium]|nr:hypothetical protein [Desulfobacteraceae bacterium]